MGVYNYARVCVYIYIKACACGQHSKHWHRKADEQQLFEVDTSYGINEKLTNSWLVRAEKTKVEFAGLIT